ncbi:hypothetical protein EW146_g2829 [Bondarzewia mesenterica]|uniref:Proteasome activator Blm10 mid region domain-containing protein n=1 Tax=Bondarzewia mesenterica TaxID=1095465 RepID=A0A4S4M108_9AGAM|nr:hypothetical protein EW146_g2829 [Bondarzewia mesenterica]
MEALLLDVQSLLGLQSSGFSVDAIMDDDTLSTPDTPVEAGFMSPNEVAMERQRASLLTYLSSVPYQCETPEEMQEKLEFIVGKLAVCIESKNWLVLATYNGALQCWLLMRYPISKPIRAKLVRLCYELCLLPGIEPRVLHNWVDMFTRLLVDRPDARRKLEATDLQLPWKPLWRVLQKELWTDAKLYNSSRNIVNVLLFLASKSNRYFSAEDIPEMLSTLIPLITQDTYLAIIPVVVSFVPPTHTHLYLPTLFKLWEAFNSSIIDDRLIELVGELSEEHVAGTAGDAGPDGGAKWKDVGIWTSKEWTALVGKALGSMNVPVGGSGGASTTGAYADSASEAVVVRVKKSTNRFGYLAKISAGNSSTQHPGYLAGSKALDSLDKLIISTESFFHPSNSGLWTMSLTSFLSRLTYEFSKRWAEEEQPACKTPVTHRLSPAIRRAFVMTLRSPALLAMFSKDPLSMSHAQSSLRFLAMLEPGLVMPELLERAYGGLEIVNETHRTTAVLSMLSGIALPLVSEKVWVGGQKHIVPLLELCIPGIDLNDPIKTVCTTMFIVSVVQHIKIGDLSMTQSGLSLSSDAPSEDRMDVGQDVHLPDGTDNEVISVLSKEEERILVRENTASFADWVTSFFRRVFALYENLPEEGGKKNMTGGKQEENVLKSLKSTLDVICLHLSDSLFDLVLKLVYDYATTNAKSNAVRAFGQLISSLARAKPAQTIDKFLPFCSMQIREELKHGASSVRTTSSNVPVPSDTTLHWNMSILRGCFGYDGVSLLKHKAQILDLLSLLVDKTFSERGWGGTGRLLARIMATLSGTYPLNSRFVNDDEWYDPEFNKDHNIHWGKMYKAEDVKVEWHVPSSDEIAFVLEILDSIVAPALDKVEVLLEGPGAWDNADRNDFCRQVLFFVVAILFMLIAGRCDSYLHVVRCAWNGLTTFWQEGPKEVVRSGLDERTEVEALVVSPLDVQAGFVLTDPVDPRHQKAMAHRERVGHVIHRAAMALGQGHEGEDHIDAVLSLTKAIDGYLLDYAMSRADFDTLHKNYTQARDLNRVWPRQKHNSRLVLMKRAQVHHSGRVYMHSLYRRRSALDDLLLSDLVELSLSSYTRVRRYAQSVLRNVCGYYVRSTGIMLRTLFGALVKGTDPDRMKGALYVLWDKGIATYAIADCKDPGLYGRYLTSLLDCQHQEKACLCPIPENSIANDCVAHLAEEAIRTNAYIDDIPVLEESLLKMPARAAAREHKYEETVHDRLCLDIKQVLIFFVCRFRQSLKLHRSRPLTGDMPKFALNFLFGLLRRDAAPFEALARLFMEHTTSPHPPLRAIAQKGITKMSAFVKIRTYSKSNDELWLDEYTNPLQRKIQIKSDAEFRELIQQPIRFDSEVQSLYIDKLRSGFLTWLPYTMAYAAVPPGAAPFSWDPACQPALQAIGAVMRQDNYFTDLTMLWGQESSRNASNPEVRLNNIVFVKMIAKMFQGAEFDKILSVIEPLLWEVDRFKQRAGVEVLMGLSRGSKHWPKQLSDQLWRWIMSRFDRIFAQIKPDTISFWEAFVNTHLETRDLRRSAPLMSWIHSLPLESALQSDSAFAMTKSFSILGCYMDTVGFRDPQLADNYFNMFLDNCNVGYAEMRITIAQNLFVIIASRWRPSYPSVETFLHACQTTEDPLRIREALYMPRFLSIIQQMPKWKQERFPPPRVAQSQYDKVGLTLLRWIWASFYGPQAPLMFTYISPMMPEIIRMTELSDDSDLQVHSQAVLYIISAVVPPSGSVDAIIANFVEAIKSSTSWRIRLNALPALVVFFYRNLLSISDASVIMDVVINCLSDENVEVREMASKALSGIVRVSQRRSIVHLKNHFVSLARKVKLPPRQDPKYAESLRTLHSAILGLCALIESFPYSVETWMPSLTDVLALHATDPPPISTTIRKSASEFKKTHQDTWHKDQLAFDEDQLQNLSTMLVGTSYYA